MNPSWNKQTLSKIITKIDCPGVNLSKTGEKNNPQSSEVTNFIRMQGNMSSSVDYRVISIVTASGEEKRKNLRGVRGTPSAASRMWNVMNKKSGEEKNPEMIQSTDGCQR